jgi:hypothetical protein
MKVVYFCVGLMQLPPTQTYVFFSVKKGPAIIGKLKEKQPKKAVL